MKEGYFYFLTNGGAFMQIRIKRYLMDELEIRGT